MRYRKLTVFALCAALTLGGVSGLGGCSDTVEPPSDPPQTVIPDPPPTPPTPPADCEHTEVSTVTEIEPTCTEGGLRRIVCDGCGAVITSENTDPLGHDYSAEFTVAVLPSERNAGESIRICSRDDRHILTGNLPALSNEGYTVTNVPATCKTVGTTTYSSEEYGEFTVYTPKLAHDYSTAQTNGKCAVCDSKVSSLELGFTLNEDGEGYTVNKTDRYTDVDLVIPAEYNGLPVTEIASEAFAEWRWITSVTVPESVKKIGAGAFSQMSGIRKVFFNAVDCADLDGRNWAFFPAVDGSSKPIELTVGSAVERIPARLFFPLATEPTANPALASIVFEEGSALKSIGDHAFYRTAVDSVAIPDSVESIGDHAFYGTQLTRLTLGKNVTALGANAFGACEKLESVEFDRKLNSIGDDCFNYCIKLESVSLGATRLQTLGADAFKNCYELKRISFPTTLAEVGDSAFYDCKKLEKAGFDGELVRIGAGAFYGCSALTEAVVPSKVVHIGNGAFENCTALALIDYRAATAADAVAGNKIFAGAGAPEGVTVIIADSVRRVPARLFFSTSDVTANIKMISLKINRGVASVGENAFRGCTADSVEYVGNAAEWSAIEIADGNGILEAVVVSGEG